MTSKTLNSNIRKHSTVKARKAAQSKARRTRRLREAYKRREAQDARLVELNNRLVNLCEELQAPARFAEETLKPRYSAYKEGARIGTPRAAKLVQDMKELDDYMLETWDSILELVHDAARLARKAEGYRVR